MSRRVAARLGFFLLLLAGTALLRWPGRETRFWNVDEAVTFTMAQQIRAGEVPYRDAVDQRPPLVPYLQAAVFAVTGDWNLKAQHAVLTLMIGLTAGLLWLAARAMGEAATGAAGALWFTLLAFVLPSVRDTMPAHTAWYLVFFSTAGFYALARAWTSGRAGWAVASGAAFGLSFLAKQPGILDFGVALVLPALGCWTEPARRKEFAGLLAGLAAGFALPVIGTAVYFAAHGAWADLVYYTWTYNNTLYVPEIPPLERWQTIRVPFDLAWEFSPLVVVTGGLAILALLRHAFAGIIRRPQPLNLPVWLILGWCASGLISTTLSGRGFTHYSIQLLPGLGLACGWLTGRVWKFCWGGGAAGRARRAAALAAAVLFGAALLQRLPVRIRALDLPDPGSDIITQLVRQNTGPRDRIFVWGYNPEVYALSERLPATRFLYCTFLTGLIPWTNLDPLKNTDYAVVPGAWDNFLADWKKHPPALVADGRGQRGFLKYKLDRQPRLWPLIEQDYAQIEVEPAALHGFWMFRRLENLPPHPLSATAQPGGDLVQISAEPAFAGQTARVAVHAPAGTRFLELYLDGALYRRLPCAGNAPVSAVFLVPGADRPAANHRIQAAALVTDVPLTSPEITLGTRPPVTVIGGPPLDFAGQPVAALESSTITGGPILPKKEAPDHWDAHAPSRLVYPRLPGMNSLAFAFGIEEMALERKPPEATDGIEVVVQVEDETGRLTQVYRRYFDPETARRTKGRAVDYTPLPPLSGGAGRIILLMTPGPQNIPVLDWSYWLWIRAAPSAIALLADGAPRQPGRVEAASLRQAEFNGRFVTVSTGPALFEFAATPDLFELSGGFGLLDTAWLGSEKTGPVDFVISLRKPDGKETKLFERQLDPAKVTADRGIQNFNFAVPQPAAGTLRFIVRPVTGNGKAETFWSQLSAILLRTSLRFHDEVIPALPESAGQFGFLNTDEGGRDCLVAHAPATLVYAWREGLVRLTGEYGMKAASYNGNDTEGVVFVVETEDAKGLHRELFRRHLAPKTREADRGDQQLSVEIPALPGGRIILRTLPPPSGHLNAAWSYWRELRGDR